MCNYRTFDPYIFLRPEVIRIGEGARIDSFVKIEGGDGVEIGRHVHIASFCHLNVGGGFLSVGEHSGFSSGVRVCTGYPDISLPYTSAADDPDYWRAIHSYVYIGQRVVVFANAVILPGVTIGDGAIVGAGSVVTKDIPEWEIWVGNPAHFLRKRILHEHLSV